MSEVAIGIIALFAVLVIFLTGIELAVAMLGVGFVGFGFVMGWEAALNLLAKDFFNVFSTYGYTTIPLFMLMGQIAFNSGIAKRLFDTSYKFVGHIPGGVALATVAGATAFKSICGSTPATSATFAIVAVPEMDRYGYDKRLSTGIVASVGTLGTLIPPSVTLIVLGIITDQSIGKLFMAGLIPGLIVAALFACVILSWCKINPKVGPKGEKSIWSERWRSVPEVGWVLLIFVLSIGGILFGFFTPTEAGSVGTFLVLILAFARTKFNLKAYFVSVAESVRGACMVLLLLYGSTVLGHLVAVTTIPMVAADWIVSLPFPPAIIILLISIIYLVGGSFIDDVAFMILATPIFFPAVLKLGYDPIWFVILVCITVMMGVILPPVAMCVFIVKQITKIPLGTIYAGCYPFLASLIIAGILVFIFPELATWLPSITMGK